MSKYMDDYFLEVDRWFMNQPTELKDTCIVCGCTMHKHFDDNMLFGKDIVKCGECGFVWRKNQPTQEVLNEFYASSKAMKSWSDLKKTPDESFRQEEKYRHIWDYIYHNEVKSILDVGCGDGSFLRRIMSDCRKVGIDPSYEYAPAECGFPLYRSYERFQNSLHSAVKFEMVTMFGVLEHFKDPVAEIKRYYKHLKPNGIMCIIVPNVESLIVKTVGTVAATFCPQHLSYFSINTIEILLKKLGVDVELYYTIEPETQQVLRWLNGFHPYCDLGIELTHPDINDKTIIEANRGYKLVVFGRKICL
jgi:2-polyprenyl-3-methyl-5-hydroxy-6-metoxy-1,4-benzoquinol methylase